MKDGLNKNPKGKLYAKYYNSTRTLKISGLVPIKEPSVKTISKSSKHDIEFGRDKIVFNYIILCLVLVYTPSCLLHQSIR